MGMSQDAFTRLKAYDRVIKRDIIKRFESVQSTPLAMRQRFVRAVKVTLYVFPIEGIVDGPLVHSFYPVIVVPQRYIEAGMCDMFRIERMADDVIFVNSLPDLYVAVNPQIILQGVHLIVEQPS